MSGTGFGGTDFGDVGDLRCGDMFDSSGLAVRPWS